MATIKYDGYFLFDCEMSEFDYCSIETLFGESTKNHPTWGILDNHFYINLAFYGRNRTGLMWNNHWDDYDSFTRLADSVNLVTKLMRQIKPDFKLKGIIESKSDHPDYCYTVFINEDGIAKTRENLDNFVYFNDYCVERNDFDYDDGEKYFVLRIDPNFEFVEASIEAIKTYAKKLGEKSSYLEKAVLKHLDNELEGSVCGQTSVLERHSNS